MMAGWPCRRTGFNSWGPREVKPNWRGFEWIYDVIVVGGGGAGLAAAIAAAKAGASVMVVEADTKLGGATALSSGVVYAAGTAPQRAAGIEDTPEAMFNHFMSLNQWSVRPALARILAHEGASIIDWLIELGNDFPPHLIVESGVGGCPRGHQSIDSGYGIVQSLINHVGALGVEVAARLACQRPPRGRWGRRRYSRGGNRTARPGGRGHHRWIWE